MLSVDSLYSLRENRPSQSRKEISAYQLYSEKNQSDWMLHVKWLLFTDQIALF